MDFFSVVLVLLIYYIRPQDWVPGIIGVGIVNPVMMLAILAMVLRARQKGVSLKFLQTPQDWAVLAYYAFMVYGSQDPMATLKGAFPLFAFYFVTIQALDSPDRLRKYLKFWLLALVVLSGFGVASRLGWDPTGAVAATEANKGRLALGTWMHNNPNALGHTVILAIPLAYFLYFWKRPMTEKILATGICWLAFTCVEGTESKGAFLAGFSVLVLSYSFGRSKMFQILMLSAALAGGGAVLSLLPRMSEMGSLRTDEAFQGRMLAWEMARMASKQHMVTGQGWKTFRASIRWQKLTITKATHSSYVQIGAELGKGGMFLYMGMLWLGLKSLLLAKGLDIDGDRCRKCLFALLAAYVISNWMIDRAYHTEFFLFMAAISAFHRLYLLKAAEKAATVEEEPDRGRFLPDVFVPTWHPVPAGLAFPRTGAAGWTEPPRASAASDEPARVPEVARHLLKPTLVDALVAAAVTWAVFALWDYILKTMLY